MFRISIEFTCGLKCTQQQNKQRTPQLAHQGFATAYLTVSQRDRTSPVFFSPSNLHPTRATRADTKSDRLQQASFIIFFCVQYKRWSSRTYTSRDPHLQFQEQIGVAREIHQAEKRKNLMLEEGVVLNHGLLQSLLHLLLVVRQRRVV